MSDIKSVDYLLSKFKNILGPNDYPTTDLQFFIIKLRLLIRNAIDRKKDVVDFSKLACDKYTKYWNQIIHLLNDEFCSYILKFNFPIKCYITTIKVPQRHIHSVLSSNKHVLGLATGQLVGNALGIRYTSLSKQAAQQLVYKDCDENQHLTLLGKTLPGAISEQMEIAILVGNSFCGISIIALFQLAQAFFNWYLDKKFDETTPFFSAIKRGSDPQEIYTTILQNARRCSSTNNYCVVIVAPLALIGIEYKSTDQDIINFATQICRMISNNTVCIDAVRVFITALRYALRGNNKNTIWDAAYNAAQTEIIKNILIASQTMVSPTLGFDGELYETDSPQQDFVGISLHCAFYELMNGSSFEESLQQTMRRGGDTAGNGAITGALLGAYYGLDAIPLDWRATVLNADITSLSAKMNDLLPARISLIATSLARFQFDTTVNP